MADENQIGKQILKIRTIFQNVQDFFANNSDRSHLIDHLESSENEFRSVAYEAASMELAIADLSGGTELKNWQLFAQKNSVKHSAQIHAGLGWALAQQNKPLFEIPEKIIPLERGRVLDGYGYYDGMFRQRQTIKNKKIPEGIDSVSLHAYDQGVGRSLWYISQGETDKLKSMITVFPATRHPALWRGIGVATAYVGGFNETDLNSVFSLASDNQVSLMIGICLAARARSKAGAMTHDTEMACNICCKMSATKAAELTIKAEPDTHDANAYAGWMLNVEKALRIELIETNQ